MCEMRRPIGLELYAQELACLADQAQEFGHHDRARELIEALYTVYDQTNSGSLSASGWSNQCSPSRR